MKNSLVKRLVIVSFTLITAMGTHAESFKRIASWATVHNVPENFDKDIETSAEIITAANSGKTLIYSDSPLKGVGFIDISEPSKPKGSGFLALSGEPTSVTVTDEYALVGVNTSASFVRPSGTLATISLVDKKVVNQCELGGQPDSVAVSKDYRYIAIAIENERDENLNQGQLPQLPAGNLVILPLQQGQPICSQKKLSA